MSKYIIRDSIDEKYDKEFKNLNPIIRKLLFYRGIKNAKEASEFISPDYDLQTHNPFLLKDAKKAVDRILLAIKNNERIAIYSDYDHDGIPGAVIFHDFFKKINYNNFLNYIPHRHREGFGFNKGAVQTLFDDNVKLIITIDCGIADIESVEIANKLGIDVIITDHHIPNELPKAFAIVNPKQKDCEYPEKMLCGAGVAYKLIQAILLENRFDIKEGWEKWLLDMVGIATLSDMVPLTGENRVFAYYGLKVLRKTKRAGLLKLLNILKIKQSKLNEDDIGFSISPRINAAGRMDKPDDAFHLLSTNDEETAGKLAEYLDKINNERKGKVASIVKEANHNIVGRKEYFEERKIIVIGNPEWRPAFLGLVANSLADKYKKPAFVWGREGENDLKGSYRSDGKMDILNILSSVSEGVFIQYGGHKMAGGFSVLAERIHFLNDELEKAFKLSEKIKAEDEIKYIDASISLEDIGISFFNDLEKLAPFGFGNPKPIFIFNDIVPEKVELFGKEKKHLKINFRKKNGEIISAISFFAKEDSFQKKAEVGKSVNLIANIEKNYFGYKEEIRLRIVEIV